MRFWDASALIATEVEEKKSANILKLVASDHRLVVWMLTGVELASALWRRRRNHEITEEQRSAAERNFDATLSRAVVISDAGEVASRARRLLATHNLRAADALQLGAALLACDDEPSRLAFVTLDERLAEAATREGFAVEP